MEHLNNQVDKAEMPGIGGQGLGVAPIRPCRGKGRRKKGTPPGKIAACLSDTHCGHRLGVCNPATLLDDVDGRGQRYQQAIQVTETQRTIWEKMESDRAAVAELAQGRPVALIVNGDLTHGLKHPEDLMSMYLHHQILIAFGILEAWLTDPDLKIESLRLVQGTAAHTLSGATEPLVAQLVSFRHPGLDVGVVFHGLFYVEGAPIDAVHRGPYPGSREWLKGNVAKLSLKSMMLRELLDGRTPPRVVLRAHYHRYLRETERVTSKGITYESDVIMTPSYCGMDLHGHHATQGLSWQDHGMVALEMAAGKLVDVKPLVETLDLRTREVL